MHLWNFRLCHPIPHPTFAGVAMLLLIATPELIELGGWQLGWPGHDTCIHLTLHVSYHHITAFPLPVPTRWKPEVSVGIPPQLRFPKPESQAPFTMSEWHNCSTWPPGEVSSVSCVGCILPPTTLLFLATMLLVTSLLLCHRLHAERDLVDIKAICENLKKAHAVAAQSTAQADHLREEVMELRKALQQREVFLAQVLVNKAQDGQGTPSALSQEARTLPLQPVSRRYVASGSSFAMSAGEVEWPIHEDSSVHTASIPQRMR
eukprot:symbB.v1.2.024764.t1/scaffold2368.1/size81091/7